MTRKTVRAVWKLRSEIGGGLVAATLCAADTPAQTVDERGSIRSQNVPEIQAQRPAPPRHPLGLLSAHGNNLGKIDLNRPPVAVWRYAFPAGDVGAVDSRDASVVFLRTPEANDATYPAVPPTLGALPFDTRPAPSSAAATDASAYLLGFFVGFAIILVLVLVLA